MVVSCLLPYTKTATGQIHGRRMNMMLQGNFPPPDTVYTTLDDIPKSWHTPFRKIPEEWHVFYPDRTTKVRRISQPALVYCHCMQRWALVSDTTKKENFGKWGDYYRLSQELSLALSTNQVSQDMEIVAVESDEGKELYSFIENEFDASEYAQNQSISQSERDTTHLELLNLVRNKSPHNGSYVYFFEAKKDYKDNTRNPCISYMRAWMLKNSDGTYSFLKKEFHVYENEMMYISKDIILGILTLNKKVYWIVRDRGYEGEVFMILDVTPSGIKTILSVYGGGC